MTVRLLGIPMRHCIWKNNVIIFNTLYMYIYTLCILDFSGLKTIRAAYFAKTHERGVITKTCSPILVV